MLGAVDRLAGVVQGALDPLDAEGRLGLVDLAGELDELGVEVVLAGLEGEVEGVDRQAVAAHARTGVEAHEAEGLGRGGVDHLPDVDAEPVAELGELVDEGDVDRAEDVLEQLRQLGRLGAGEDDDLRRRSARRARGRARCRPRSGRRPASAWCGRCSRCGRGRSAPARRRGGSRAPAASPDSSRIGTQALAGGARVGGRLEHHELLRLQHLRRAPSPTSSR